MLYRWLHFNMTATYDTVAIASTQNAAQVASSCRHCIFVHTHDLGAAAGRYGTLPGLIKSQQWETLVVGQYDYIYFPEEDIVQTVDSINRWVMVCTWYVRMRTGVDLQQLCSGSCMYCWYVPAI